MPLLIEYLLKVSIALALVYVFYQLVLRRLTFYNWNRWYLVGYAALSFFIPFMNITDFLFRHELEEVQFVRMVPVYNLNITAIDAGFEWNSWNIAIVLFIAGMMLMGMRMLLQFFSLRKMKAKARLLNEGDIKLFHVEDNIMPFSFSNGIFINSKLHTEAELQEIIRHEFVHVKQKHSIDILVAELLCMVLWFHPAAWFIRKAIRQNLEFIADEKVLQDGVDKKQYQYLLLKVVGNNHYSIASNFNFSSLKNRIIMMNQIKSARMQVIRFLFVLPLVAVLLLAFREVKQKEQRKEEFKQQLLVKDTVPASEIASVNVNKNNNEKTVTIVLKNGTKETYNLNNPGEKEAFEKKYGKLDKVVPPPPPPPVPGKAVTVKPAHEDVKLNTKGYFVTIADNMGECVVIVKDKSKKIVEALKLTDWNAAEDKYEAKYGEIAPPPPPSPLAQVTVVGYPAPVSAPAAVTVEGKVATVTVAEATSPVKEVTVTGYKKVTGTTAAVADVKNVATVNTTAATEPGVVTVVGYGTSTNKPATIKLKGKISTDNVLYILDGKEVTAEEVNQMEPNNIQSISVLKDESALKLYGEKGKNGVIIITTKTKK